MLAYEDDGGDWLPAPLDVAFEALSDGRVVVDGRVYDARQGADGVKLRATGEAVRRVEGIQSPPPIRLPPQPG